MILVTGGSGQLATALARAPRVRVVGRPAFDFDRPDTIDTVMATTNPALVVNAAAWTAVDAAETDPDGAARANRDGPACLAALCARAGIPLIHISTDYVFDGEKREPYAEEDEARPISVYGASKLEGERRVLQADSKHVVARVSWVFGPDRPSFIDAIIKRARNEERVDAIADKWASPSYTIDLARMLRQLIDEPAATGVFHLTNAGSCSWQEYGQWALDCCLAEGVSLRATHVEPLKMAEMKNFIARRPVYSTLATAKYQRVVGNRPRAWQDAVRDYITKHVRDRE